MVEMNLECKGAIFPHTNDFQSQCQISNPINLFPAHHILTFIFFFLFFHCSCCLLLLRSHLRRCYSTYSDHFPNCFIGIILKLRCRTVASASLPELVLAKIIDFNGEGMAVSSSICWRNDFILLGVA